MEAVAEAYDRGMGVTVHAGEWPVNEQFGSASIDNLKTVLLSDKVNRIGHGIQIVHDQPFLHSFTSSSSSVAVCFECCLTANVGWKIKSYAAHPVREMIHKGLKVALCCDNTLLSGAADRAPTPSGEMVRFIRDCGGTYAELYGTIYNGAHSSFVFNAQQFSKEEKNEWLGGFLADVKSALQPLWVSDSDEV
jgi:adenosine deaminase